MSTTPDLSTAAWRTSSYSNGDGGECVEIADNLPGIVPVRDSKTGPGGPSITFTRALWAPFVAAIGDGSL
ncbi:DUF397 domain-containing protein [Streptomyces sp. NPDC002809]|uniref:DUF397 domain-containing protein n=1 Tax=Streptomyces sp. NPDC002809 TaxID=3154433 RepID=UPI003330F262